MSVSWSQKIFLVVNAYIGKKPWLDTLMRFFAVWGIYVLIILIFVWSLFQFSEGGFALFVFLVACQASFVIGLAVNALLGVIRPRKRPKDELPGTVELIQLRPFEYWKSFPSDHTMAAFTFVFVAMIFGLSALCSVFFLLFALLIGCSRVYVGVHFPRDIFGGLLVAFVVNAVVVSLIPPFLNLFF